jgi:amino acid transporter
VGPLALAASLVNVVVGASIFVAPSALAASAGAYAPLVFVVCAVAVGAVAVCFAEGGSRVPTSGGPYGYIDAAFGPFASFVAGTLLCVSDALALGGIAAALADTVVAVLPEPARRASHAAVIVGVVGWVALVNTAGVARGARLVSAMTAVKLAPLALFVMVGATAMRASNLAAAGPGIAAGGGLGRAVILATFAFTGMETALCASGEVAHASRTIPRALGASMAFVAALFVVIQLVAQGILGASLAASATPLADALGAVHPGLRLVMLAGAALSMFGWVGSDLLGTPRMLFALARDGWMPRALAAVHPRTHAPHVAILVYAGIGIVLALTGSFAELAVLSTLAVAPLYVLGCAAAWTLARRGVARDGEPLAFRAIGAAAVVGIASMLAMILAASLAEIAGLGVSMVACGATYAVIAWRRRRATPGRARPA